MTTTPEPSQFYGYLTRLKAMNVEALKAVFNADYPTQELQDIYVSIEYPINQAAYPGIWVDYSDTEPLVIAGVDHHEWTEANLLSPPPLPDPRDNGQFRGAHTRWKFQGYVSYTVSALSSLERDRIYDELVRLFASRWTDYNLKFRSYIEDNAFIGANMNLDQIESTGNSAAPGTPWGTDEIIYERSLNMEIVGEFVTDCNTGRLLPLSKISVIPVIDPTVVTNYPEPH